MLELRAGVAQQFDDAVTDTATAVHGHAAWLVENQQSLVLVKHSLADGLCKAAVWRARRGANACRRNANLVTFFELVMSPDTSAVDPHFPLAQDPIQAPLGQTWQFPAQKIVDPLPGRFCIDAKLAHPGHGRIASGSRVFLHDQ